MTALEVLERARERLEKYGWVQKDLGGPDRGFCAVGAVSWTGEREHFNSHGLGEVIDLLSAAVDATGPLNSIVVWNNARGRKKHQVLAAFDAAMSLALDGADCGDVP